MNKNKGITLIALIVTIIVLLILAAVSIGMIVGDNGILNKAKTVSEESKIAQDEENNRLGSYNDYMEGIVTSRGTININSSNPILLTSAANTNSGASARAAGTYKASSTSFIKTNTDQFSSYLSFTDGNGWKILKSGNYLINCEINSTYASAATNIYGRLQINQNTTIALAKEWVTSSQAGVAAGNMPIYLEENTNIDYLFSNSYPTCNHWSIVYIYALFE